MRNRTVQSVLARRHMFNNGGMVPPTPKASGILASSPSLVDAVSNDALSDMGGGTLSMAQGGAAVNMQPSYVFNQGGIAKFANGGGAYYDSPAIRMQGRPNQQLLEAAGIASEALTAKRDPRQSWMPQGYIVGKDNKGIMRNPITTVSEIINESPREQYERIFSKDIDPNRVPVEEQVGPENVTRLDKALTSIMNFGKKTGSAVGNVYDYVATPEGANKTLDQINAVNTMVRIRPDLKEEIEDYSTRAIQAEKDITGEQLEIIVSGALSRNKEGVEGYRPDSVESQAGMGAVGDGGAEDYLFNKYAQPYREQSDELAAEDEFERFRKGYLGEGSVDQEGGVAEGLPIEDPKPKSMVPGTGGTEPSESGLAEGKEMMPSDGDLPADASLKADKTIQQIKEAAETNKPEEVKKGMEDYIAEFKAAMPEYEGKTEYESGMDIVKMGMAVASGQSPNAIENISKGVLATIDNFTSDDKERRKYKQQIGLSGAKYALQKLAKDDENALSLAKENRGFKRFIVKNPFTEGGVDYKAGSIYQTTIGDMREDNFSSVLPNLTTEGIYKQIIEDKAATAALIQKSLKPKMLDAGKGSAKGAEYVKSFKDYNATLKNLKTSSTMLTMIDSSIKINAEGKVTGLTNLGNRAIAKLRASVGMSQELTKLKALETSENAGVDSLRFRDQQQVIANMMLREILGEGSKNVSNIDRQLASEIVGLMTDLKAVSMPPALLNDRLQRIRVQVTNGIKENMNNLRGTEVRWENYVNGASRRLSPEFAKVKREAMKDIVNPQSEAANRRLKESDPFAASVSKRAPLLFKDFFDMSTMKQTKKITR